MKFQYIFNLHKLLNSGQTHSYYINLELIFGEEVLKTEEVIIFALQLKESFSNIKTATF